jgi:hypothetical protein
MAEGSVELSNASSRTDGNAGVELGPPAHDGPTDRSSTAAPVLRPSLIEWMCLLGGLFLTIHYAWLMDDAYIYFRYVDNLIFLDFGLVYNKDEYVEGFSSPLWVLLLSFCRLSTINYWIIIRVLGVVAFIVFWLLLVRLNHRLVPPGVANVNFPLCYLSFAYGPLCYFTSGLESPLVQVAAAGYALFVVNPTSRWLQFGIAASPLLRHELAVPLILATVWAWFRNRSFPLALILIAIATNGLWLLFRIYYYADLFPNTFYLKDMSDIPQGLTYALETVQTYRLHIWIGALLLLCAINRIVQKMRGASMTPTAPQVETVEGAGVGGISLVGMAWPERAMMIVIALSVAAYVIRIGGDPRHYRFMAFSFCLVVCATAGLLEHGLHILGTVYRCMTAGLVGAAIATLSFICYPPQLAQHPFSGEGEFTEVNKIRDAFGHRRRKNMSPPAWSWGNEIQYTGDYASFLRETGGTYKGVGTGSWCFSIYERFDMRVIHALGLTDAILARTIMEADRPAHKQGLRPLAADLAIIYQRYGDPPSRGMMRRAVARGYAPKWIMANLESVEIIEKKIFNRHDWRENFRLAFAFPPKIDPTAPLLPKAPVIRKAVD